MKRLSDISDAELRDLRAAVREAIEAVAWYDLQVAEIQGLKQADAQFSALADGVRKMEAESKRRSQPQKH